MECDVYSCQDDSVAILIRRVRGIFPAPVEVKVAVCPSHAQFFGQYGETVVFCEVGRHEHRNAVA